MLNPAEEKEVGQSDYNFNGDEAIIAQVRYEEAINCGEVVEIESDDKDSEPSCKEEEMGMSEAIQLCEKMERVCITYVSDHDERERGHAIEADNFGCMGLQQQNAL
ncbi:hypothetical protein EDC04DRAFT_2607014 [Pisolithus marmoratus]|nr:hypothetical protein EDC04DRAFT_2607014 [Pisolithus marmoratus]